MARRANRKSGINIFSAAFPWLLIPVLVYNLVALLSAGAAPDGTPGAQLALEQAAMTIPMLSGVTLAITWGEMLVIFACIFLFVEVIKSTSTASGAITNHILSMLLFVVCLLEFMMGANFATGTFFIITCIVLVDALAGMVVTIISARRDFGIEGQG